ncbi:MAG: hypothetical protein J2P54_13095 [Bradyrhizobiaceae bacterium]|nr:hypothetical protein [Bradyrhizobiaceae bacterium]
MDTALTKALGALAPICVLLSGSAVMFFRKRTLPLFMQLFGAGCLAVAALTHVCEALRLFPGMDWGAEHSVGHYVDLCGAVLGLMLFPAGYLLHALKKQGH